MNGRALGLVLGFAADRILGDPARHHPVAAFGAVAARLEQGMYADQRPRGIAYTAVLVGGVVLAGVAAQRLGRGRPLVETALTAAATWTVLGGRTLEKEAVAVHARLAIGDLPAARQRLTHLVGRDPSGLGEDEVARAVVESVAENTSDAVVAPLVWGAVAGVPGLLGYRAANTLDAMVGHRSARYERFGWASARLDDLLNLPGSRLTGVLTLAADPCAARRAGETWRRDAAAHPSPNAGVAEAAFAGSLGIRLGGTNTYGDRVEHRAEMGDGRSPQPDDIPRATTLARSVGFGAVLVTAAVAICVRDRRLIIRRWAPEEVG